MESILIDQESYDFKFEPKLQFRKLEPTRMAQMSSLKVINDQDDSTVEVESLRRSRVEVVNGGPVAQANINPPGSRIEAKSSVVTENPGSLTPGHYHQDIKIVGAVIASYGSSYQPYGTHDFGTTDPKSQEMT